MQKIMTWMLFSLVLVLFSVPSLAAEEVKTVKVYRDYPAYIEPPLCDNPRIHKKAEPKPLLPNQVDEPKPSLAPCATPCVTPKPTPCVTSCAVSNGQYYVGGWFGINALSSNDLKYTSASVDAEYDNGYGGAVLIGYDYGALRLELEGAYRSSSVEGLKPFVAAKGDLDIQTLLLNAYYDIDTGSYLTPYLGAGVGWAEVSLDGINGDGTLLVDDDDSVLAGQVAAGFQFRLNSTISLDVGYRFLMTDDPSMKSALGKVDTEIRSHVVAVGIQYRF